MDMSGPHSLPRKNWPSARTRSSAMSPTASLAIPAVKAKLLEGKRGLIIGIANDQSIAWGCAKAFRAFGAELAVTYLNDKARKHVEPLARVLEAPIFMPLDVNVPGQMEAVFERIAKDWGRLAQRVAVAAAAACARVARRRKRACRGRRPFRQRLRRSTRL